MLVYTDSAALAAAPTTAPVSDVLRELIANRIHDWAATALLDLTYLVIVERGDTEQSLIDAVGYSPLVNTLDCKRFGDPAFVPQFEWLEFHAAAGVWELLQTVANDGAAIVLLIQDADGVDPQLLALCREYAQ